MDNNAFINHIQLFENMINIDNYVKDYLFILSKKYKHNKWNWLDIDNYYSHFLNNIIHSKNKTQIGIIIQDTYHDKSIEQYLKFKIPYINLDYFIQHYGSITIGYLYYIIQYWDDLPSQLLFYNHLIEHDKYIFPLCLYLIPKKKIDILINHYQTIVIENQDISLSQTEKHKLNTYPDHFNFKEWCNTFLNINVDDIHVIEYCPELIFSINTNSIKKKEKIYYQTILTYFIQRPFCKEMIYLEKMWYYLFI